MTAASLASLLAKPLFLTMPLLLLLIDGWATAWKLRGREAAALLPEKLPLAAIAATFVGLTIWAQRSIGATELVTATLPERLAHGVVSYWRYLFMQVWPVHLSVFYPYLPTSMGAGAVVLAGLAAVTAACWSLRQRWPAGLFGWLWFCIALVPMAGFVQAGSQGYADRFSLLPSVGLVVVLVFSLPARWAARRRTIAWAGSLAALLLVVLTERRLTLWQSTVPLLEDALQTAPDDYALHNNVALAYLRQGQLRTAASHFRRATELNPQYLPAIQDGYDAYRAVRDLAGAVGLLEGVVQRDPTNAYAQDLLGITLASTGRIAESVSHFRAAVRLDPASAAYQDHLAQAQAATRPAASAPATAPAPASGE